MKGTEFVAAIRRGVEDSAVDGCLSCYSDPPGRRPSAALTEVSEWYKTLSNEDQHMLKAVMKDVAHASVFGFLCVLDGVRAIEDGKESGELQLWYVKGKHRSLVNDPSKIMLHDVLNAT